MGQREIFLVREFQTKGDAPKLLPLLEEGLTSLPRECQAGDSLPAGPGWGGSPWTMGKSTHSTVTCSPTGQGDAAFSCILGGRWQGEKGLPWMTPQIPHSLRPGSHRGQNPSIYRTLPNS